MTNETRTTDADTGAQKGVKLERFDLVPIRPLTELARHYGMGAAKYEDRNWERGYTWDKSYGAAQRHLTQFWGGEDLDPDPFYDQFPEEVRPKHVIAAAWHCFALAQFMDTHPEKDARPVLHLPGGKVHQVGLREDLTGFAKWALSTPFDPSVRGPEDMVDLFLTHKRGE